jgi:hypothetical protein
MPKAYAVITYQSISDSEKHTAYSKLPFLRLRLLVLVS